MVHLKRLSTPRSWPVKRKENTYISKPSPGPHTQKTAIAINVILRDILEYSKTVRETKKVLHDKQVMVNERIVQDHRFPVGILDQISIEAMKETFVLLYKENGKLFLQKMGKEKHDRALKIVNKTILSKNRVQLNLYDGENIIVDKDTFKVGDSIILENKKVKKHLKFEKGALVYLVGGKHIGAIGSLEEVKKTQGFEKERIIVGMKKEKIETAKEYAFVIDKPFE